MDDDRATSYQLLGLKNLVKCLVHVVSQRKRILRILISFSKTENAIHVLNKKYKESVCSRALSRDVQFLLKFQSLI